MLYGTGVSGIKRPHRHNKRDSYKSGCPFFIMCEISGSMRTADSRFWTIDSIRLNRKQAGWYRGWERRNRLCVENGRFRWYRPDGTRTYLNPGTDERILRKLSEKRFYSHSMPWNRYWHLCRTKFENMQTRFRPRRKILWKSGGSSRFANTINIRSGKPPRVPVT